RRGRGVPRRNLRRRGGGDAGADARLRAAEHRSQAGGRRGLSATGPTPGEQVLALWRRCERLPFGRAIFRRLFRAQVPYSGSIRATVLVLEPGHAQLAMQDRRTLRNHLGSIHAAALANLGELASGLAMTTAVPAGVRAIALGLSCEYVKKARGTLVAESRVQVPEVRGDLDHEVTAEIRDGQGEVVATARVRWRLGRIP